MSDIVKTAKTMEWAKLYQYPVVRDGKFTMTWAIKVKGEFVFIEGDEK